METAAINSTYYKQWVPVAVRYVCKLLYSVYLTLFLANYHNHLLLRTLTFAVNRSRSVLSYRQLSPAFHHPIREVKYNQTLHRAWQKCRYWQLAII